MIPKRYRVVLLVVLAVVGLLGACLAVVVLPNDPDRAGFDRIREGMTPEEAIAVMGRTPDQWVGPIHDSATSPWPPPPGWDHLVNWLFWENNVHDVAQVHLDSANRVDRKSWTDHHTPPLWDRLRCWLHL